MQVKEKTVALYTLQRGDRFRFPGKKGIYQVSYQHDRMIEEPEGQLQVVPVYYFLVDNEIIG